MLHYFLLTIFLLACNAHPSPSEPPTVVDIVGGKEITIQDYPFVASILDESGLICGGCIITNYYTITAGHCVFYIRTGLLVHAGSSYWNKDGSYHLVEATSSLGHFKSTDLAILRVKEPFNFDDTCQPIPLFNSGEVAKPETMAVVLGWGDTNVNELSVQLRAVSVPIIDREKCRYIYANSSIGEIVDGELCAGYLDKGGKDACTGDSGGPMVIDGRLAGIVTMGEGCARPHAPGIYTDIAYYSNWINEQISQ